MQKPHKEHTDREWLAAYGAELVRRDAAIEAIDRSRLDLDIQARRLEAEWAEEYVRNRPTLIEILDKLGIIEKDWCGKGLGISYSTVMRRIQLSKGLDHYLRRRPSEGYKFTLEHAVYLARPEKPEDETSSRPTRTRIAPGTPDPIIYS